MPAPTKKNSPRDTLFWLLVPAVAAFIITILASTAALFGNPEAPVARLLDQYGGTLLLVEFVVIVALCIAAMTADRVSHTRNNDRSDADAGT